MSTGAVARRYAEAVFEIGVEKRDVDTWMRDLRTIAEYFGNKRLAFVLGEPNIAFERKRLVVTDLLQGKVSHDALGLALLLVERGLVPQTQHILDQFELRYNDYHHQAVATVTTALPLDDATRDQVRGQLARLTGKTILLEEKVDPSILGGVIARVGDLLIDNSVRYRLSKLRQQMIQGGGSFGGSSDGRDPTPTGPTGPAGPPGGPGGLPSAGGPGGPPSGANGTPTAPPSTASGQQPASAEGTNASPNGSNPGTVPGSGGASLSTGARHGQVSAHRAPREPTARANPPQAGVSQSNGPRRGETAGRGQLDRRGSRRGKGRRR